MMRLFCFFFFVGIPSDCYCYCVARSDQTPPGKIYQSAVVCVSYFLTSMISEIILKLLQAMKELYS